MDDELLDLADENDTVIGTINRKDYNKLIEEQLGYIRASELFILNSEGKLWVPIRTATKTIAPNGYDYSAAGHVGSGDDYLQTIIREAKEEINLDITAVDLEYIDKMRSDVERYFRSVYLLRSDVTPTFNPHDFVSAQWLTPTELLASVDGGHPAKASLRTTVERLQDYLSGN